MFANVTNRIRSGKTESIIEYLIFLSILVNSNSVWTSSPIKNYVNIFTYIVIIFEFFLLSLKKNNISIRSTLLPFAINTAIICILFLIQGGQYSLGKTINLVMVVPVLAAVFSNHIENDSLRICLERVINSYLIITIPGFIFWILSLFNLVTTNTVLPVSWGAASVGMESVARNGYYDALFEMQWIDNPFTGSHILRFTSIFVEAPVFAGISLIILSMALFWGKTPLWKILLITSMCIASFSTTAFVIVPVILLFKYFSVAKYQVLKNGFDLRIVEFAVLCLLITVFAIIYVPTALSYKAQTDSGHIRYNDIISGVSAFLDSPFWGHGINNFDALTAYMSSYKDSSSQTSTFLSILGQGGIILILLYFFPFFFVKKKFGSLASGLQFHFPVFVFIIVMLNCNLEFATIIYLFIAIGYALAFAPKQNMSRQICVPNKFEIASNQ